jgi:hypothetical protein
MSVYIEQFFVDVTKIKVWQNGYTWKCVPITDPEMLKRKQCESDWYSEN